VMQTGFKVSEFQGFKEKRRGRPLESLKP